MVVRVTSSFREAIVRVLKQNCVELAKIILS